MSTDVHNTKSDILRIFVFMRNLSLFLQFIVEPLKTKSMKNQIAIATSLLCALGAYGQTKNFKSGVTLGGTINHYNGNLGNSFFQFKTTCFAGIAANYGAYVNKSFDVNIGASVGHFGYCQKDEDEARFVSLELRCPGCTDRLGMGELRSLMMAGNAAVKYKFANGYILRENAKLAPYAYAGLGVTRLTDNMKRDCVNEGNHFTLNGGVGVQYRITERWNIQYNLAVSCFTSKKVYFTNAMVDETGEMDEVDIQIERRKDLLMQNSLSIGFNF